MRTSNPKEFAFTNGFDAGEERNRFSTSTISRENEIRTGRNKEPGTSTEKLLQTI
jgi:hypothetical protein